MVWEHPRGTAAYFDKQPMQQLHKRLKPTHYCMSSAGLELTLRTNRTEYSGHLVTLNQLRSVTGRQRRVALIEIPREPEVHAKTEAKWRWSRNERDVENVRIVETGLLGLL